MKKIYFLLITICLSVQSLAELNYKTNLTEEEVNAVTQEESNNIQQILCVSGFCSGPKIDAVLNKIGYEGKDWQVKATKHDFDTTIEVYGRDKDAPNKCKYLRGCQEEKKFLGRFLVDSSNRAKTARSYEQLSPNFQREFKSNTIFDHENKLYEFTNDKNEHINVFDKQSGKFVGVVDFVYTNSILSAQHIKDNYVNSNRLSTVDENLVHENQGKQQVTPHSESNKAEIAFDQLDSNFQQQIRKNSIFDGHDDRLYEVNKHYSNTYIDVYDGKEHIGVLKFENKPSYHIKSQHIVTKYKDKGKLNSVDEKLIHSNQGKSTPTPYYDTKKKGLWNWLLPFKQK